MHTSLVDLGLDRHADPKCLVAMAATEDDWRCKALLLEAAADLSHDPKHRAAAAFAWQMLGDHAEASAAYDRALARGSHDLQTWCNAAEAFVDAGLVQKALVAIERVLAIDARGDHPASRRVRLLALKAARELQAGEQR